ncbi:MAG: DUF393 domain-containing protein [Pseudobacteriovorax sp.]|nr:DUF393 domain-containing protein [Pseudobacteriovorax sp.]
MITLAQQFKQLKATTDKVSQSFLTQEKHLQTQKLFKNILYLWLLFHTLVLLPYAQIIWGPETIFDRPAFIGGWDWIKGLMRHPSFINYYGLVIGAQVVALVAGILGYFPRLTSVLVWFLTLNLNEQSYPIQDGGNNLCSLLLIYFMFVNTSGRPQSCNSISTMAKLNIGLSNLCFYTSRLQVVVVYLCAGWLKLNGKLWQSGMSLYYIFQNPDYSRPMFSEIIVSYEYLALLGTYFAVFFQISFPFLIWFRKTRPFVIIAGTLLHAGIAIGMGLFTFGTLMFISYILFFRESWVESLKSTFPLKGKLIVGFDETCGICQKFAKMLTSLDWNSNLTVDGAYTPISDELQNIDESKRTTEMWLWNSTKQSYASGFEAVLTIAAHIPLRRVLWPVLWILHYIGAGEHIYRTVANRRNSCTGGLCEIQRPQKPS